MHLSEVGLTNWRSYRSAEFRFPLPVDEKKKVFLVGAMNGTGKTSLLMALYLGLFGRDGMYYVEGVRFSDEEEKQRSYRQLMQSVLHRNALGDAEPQVKVQLVFDMEDEAPLTITRTWHYWPRGQIRDINTWEGEEVHIQQNNRYVPLASWKDANIKIEDLLFPAHVLPCFFFDGEQAQKRVEGAGDMALSGAMQTLFGTRLLGGLSDTLRQYSTQKRSRINSQHKEVRSDELWLNKAKYDALDGELKDLRTKLGRARAELKVAMAQREVKQEELLQVAGHANTDFKMLSQEKGSLESQERDQEEQLQRDLGTLALPIALKGFGNRVVNRLESEIVRDRWLLLRDSIAGKVEEVVQGTLSDNNGGITPVLTTSQKEQIGKRIRGAMESIWSPPPNNCAAQHHFLYLTASDRPTILTKISSMAGASAESVISKITSWESTKQRLAEVRRKWDAVQDVQPKLQLLKSRLDSFNDQVAELSREASTLENNERQMNKEKDDLEAAIGRMEESKKRRGPEEGRIELADRIRKAITSLGNQLKPLCEGALASSCTRHFREMISEEYKQHTVEFDEEAQPRLILKGRAPVYVTTLSGAQKRAFGLAFTLAIAEVSGQDAPIVIDTPVGSMDSEFRRRILRYMAETAPGQLFFLSHDEEIYGEYVQELEPYLAERYLIRFRPDGEGTGESSVETGSYFAEKS